MEVVHKRLPLGIAENEDALLHQMREHNSFGAHMYTHQIGQVFSALGVVEDTIISALWMCEGIEIDRKTKTLPDTEAFMHRKSILQGQTFGNLIKVLRKNGVSDSGIKYFEFLKSKRDKFIHRFFEDNAFPGELRDRDFVWHVRLLRYFEVLFARAPNKIWKIIGNEKYHKVVDLGPDGLLIMNDMWKEDSQN